MFRPQQNLQTTRAIDMWLSRGFSGPRGYPPGPGPHQTEQRYQQGPPSCHPGWNQQPRGFGHPGTVISPRPVFNMWVCVFLFTGLAALWPTMRPVTLSQLHSCWPKERGHFVFQTCFPQVWFLPKLENEDPHAKCLIFFRIEAASWRWTHVQTAVWRAWYATQRAYSSWVWRATSGSSSRSWGTPTGLAAQLIGTSFQIPDGAR